MIKIFVITISVVIIQRLTELIISKKNEKWLLSNGAVEFGASHYKYIVIMHTCFFLSLIIEFWYSSASKNMNSEFNTFNLLFLVFFIILQFGRVWVLVSLGSFWNTKIFRIVGVQLINRGPYRYFKHPNYIVVCLEILILPLVFNLYFTAVVFTILNALILSVRIKEESRALEI
ncbi:alkylpyrone methyltransferase [soil metagenome]